MFSELASRWPDSSWLGEVCSLAESKLRDHPHGDLPRWREALKSLPECDAGARLDFAAPELGSAVGDQDALKQVLMELHPWRKGPLSLGGVNIDSEWRSDWKWERIAPHIELGGHRVLDIGCGNGYFGLRMLGAGAELVVGIDPTLLFIMQWLACRHFSGPVANYVLPLGIEEIPESAAGFDSVFSMGVLYHRRDPSHHLCRVRSCLKTGGAMILETMVLPKGHDEDLFVPQDRYARMRNVWAIPRINLLLRWVKEAGFGQVDIVNVTATTTQEQRSTRWMSFESLEQALDPSDESRTVEGHPAPLRAVLVARC